jgi:hypothetical protein
VLKKIELFTPSGVECDFFKDGLKIAEIIARLNICKDATSWLSLQPNPLRYAKRTGIITTNFGEVNGDNKLHGRGIQI